MSARAQGGDLMKMRTGSRSYGFCARILAFLFGALSVLSNHAQAQGSAAGNKAVYGTNGVTFSEVWIDASGSAFWTSGAPDLCGTINTILTSTNYSKNYPNGAVIDARGLVFPGAQQPITCSGNPFKNVTATSPSTVLLPSAVIPIGETWTLPNNTKIVGEGPWTWIRANTPANFTGSYMIEMGSSASCPAEGCSGVGIEHLLLDASQNQQVGGIHNQYSQKPSYVKDVNLHQFSLTGLNIGGATQGTPGAIDSGPYSNLTFSTNFAASCGATCPVCVDIEAQTRGLHGITCIGSPNTGELGPQDNAAIYVNASNNSIEDVHVEAFWDGIEVADATSAVGNVVISNVTGSASQSSGTGKCEPPTGGNNCRVINTVHICGSHTNSQFGSCSITNGSVSDVTILQVAALTNNEPPTTTTVEDDVTGTSLIRIAGSPTTTTGMYVLGEVLGGGNTRFAVSPAPTGNFASSSSVVPTWGVGIASPATQTCSTPGALYSNTQGTSSGNAVFVCTGFSGSFVWQPIPAIP
jgi:hypothetical protein